jgi:hypothetical protein
MLFTIKASGGSLPAGTHKATFVSVSLAETSKGEALKWTFRTENGAEASFYSDTKPTTKNKAGRWLAALSGKSLAEGVAINASEFAGRKYLLIVEANDRGGTSLNTFTAIHE